MRANILLLFYLYIALAPLPLRDELARLPGLIAHFQLHRLDDPEQGFISFLLQHYGQEFASHQAEHDHSELPGKSHPAHDCACTAAMAQIVPANDIPRVAPTLGDSRCSAVPGRQPAAIHPSRQYLATAQKGLISRN